MMAPKPLDIEARLFLETFAPIVVLDELSRVHSLNRRAEYALGWSAEALIGHDAGDIFNGLRDLVFKPSAEGVVIAEQVEGSVIRKDGSRFPVEFTIWSGGLTLGQRYLVSFRDITSQKIVEAKNEQLYRAIVNVATEWRGTFDSISMPIVLVDEKKRIRRLNKAASDISGLHFKDLVEKPLDVLLHEPFLTPVGEGVDEVLQTGIVSSFAIHDPVKNSHWSIEITPLNHSSMYPNAAIVVARDITELIQLQESLRRNESMSLMGSLVGGVCHEIRTPLFAISALVQAMEAKYAGYEELAQYTKGFRREIDRVSRLAQDLLEYGKPRTFHISLTSLSLIVAEAIDEARTVLAAARSEVRNGVDDGLPVVQVEAERLVIAFKTLIENAAQHSPPEGIVGVEAHFDGARSRIVCSVCDQGPGFAPADLPHVFEPFFSRRKGGVGLGLSIAKQIVSQHGGEIAAENIPGGGARVYFWIPVVL